MARDFLPRGDGALAQWGRNFARLIGESWEQYDLTEEEAAELVALNDQWLEDFRLATEPETRTRAAVARKDASRARFKRQARVVARQVQNRMNVTDSQRVVLGLTVAAPKSPIPVPPVAPLMEIIAASGWQVLIQLRCAGSGRRGKPKGVASAEVRACPVAVGGQPPAKLKDWPVFKVTSRNRVRLTLRPEMPAGTRVLICARWWNPRGQAGPACGAAAVIIGGGVPQMPVVQNIRLAA